MAGEKREQRTIQAVLEAADSRTSPSGKPYMSVTVGGETLSCWDANTGQTAKMCIGVLVNARVSRRPESKYWNIDTIEPLSDVIQPAKTSVSHSPVDRELEIRKTALEAASRLFAGCAKTVGSGVAVMDDTIVVAAGFELYLRGDVAASQASTAA